MWQKPKPWEYAAIFLVVLILAAIIFPVFAKPRPRIPGAVLRDANHRPMFGVPVRFRDTQTGQVVSFTTDAYGSIRWNGLREVPGYWPPRLPPRYELLDYAVVKHYRQTGGFLLSPVGTYAFRVQDATGNPIRQLPVSVVHWDATGRAGEFTTDDRGRFTIPDLPLALYDQVMHIRPARPGWVLLERKRTATGNSVEYRLTVAPASVARAR